MNARSLNVRTCPLPCYASLSSAGSHLPPHLPPARNTLYLSHQINQKHGVGEHTSKPKRNDKTYNRRDSQMVTHSSTSRPVQCLCMAERTGCPVFTDLWSYVSSLGIQEIYTLFVVLYTTSGDSEATESHTSQPPSKGVKFA